MSNVHNSAHNNPLSLPILSENHEVTNLLSYLRPL